MSLNLRTMQACGCCWAVRHHHSCVKSMQATWLMFGDLKAFTATCDTLQPEGLLTCVPGTLALPNIIWEACARVEAIAPAKEQRRSCILSNPPRYPNRRSPACCPSDFCTHAMVSFSRHPKQWSRLSRGRLRW